jgi:hypothetical protein
MTSRLYHSLLLPIPRQRKFHPLPQGYYNLLIASGLIYSLAIQQLHVKLLFLAFVFGAASFGAITVHRRIILTQGSPAIIAMILEIFLADLPALHAWGCLLAQVAFAGVSYCIGYLFIMQEAKYVNSLLNNESSTGGRTNAGMST